MPAGTFVDNDNDGLPDLLEDNDLDLIKKGFLTDYVKKQVPEYNKESESTKVINLTGGRSGDKNDTTDFIDRVISTASNGSAQELADLLYEMTAGNGTFEVTNAKVNKSNKGFVIEYNTGKYNENDNPIKAKRSFNPFDKNFAVDLANFYQRATGSDAKLEKNILTGKANYGQNQKIYLIKDKEYRSDELLKMYTQDQIDQAIKSGTVKIK
jgi:hypothetical protein